MGVSQISVESYPAFLQNQTYSAEITRRGTSGFDLVRGATIGSVSGGVVNLAAGDLALSPPGSGLSVSVAAGECMVPGSSSASQSSYYLRNTSSLSISLSAASPTYPRIDLICATIEDAAYTGSSNLGLIQGLTGTPTSGASLSNLTGAPALPTSSLVLGYVLVPANASNIITADILNDMVQLQGSLPISPSGVSGATAASGYVGATTSGSPSSGSFGTGNYIVAQNGAIWICTAGGSPGTWTSVGAVSAAAIEASFTGTGQLYVGTGNGGGKQLAVGTAGYVLTSGGTGATGPSWQTSGIHGEFEILSLYVWGGARTTTAYAAAGTAYAEVIDAAGTGAARGLFNTALTGITAYFEATLLSTVGTTSAELYDVTGAAAVANSGVGTTSTTAYVPVRSSAIAPTAADTLVVYMKNSSGANDGELGKARIVGTF